MQNAQNAQNAKVFKTQSAVPPVCIHISNCTNIKCAVYLEHAAYSAHQSPYIAKTYKMQKNKMQRASCCSVAASLSQISGAAAVAPSPLYVRMHTLWTVLCTVWSVVNSVVQKVQCCAKSVHKVQCCQFSGQLPPLHSLSQNMWQLLHIIPRIPQLAENYVIIISPAGIDRV